MIFLCQETPAPLAAPAAGTHSKGHIVAEGLLVCANPGGAGREVPVEVSVETVEATVEERPFEGRVKAVLKELGFSPSAGLEHAAATMASA